MVNASQRGLTKPKSKIRLRLGLTPPHPKPVPAQTTSERVITSTAISTATAASATQLSPPVTSGPLAKSNSNSKSIVTASTYSVASPGAGGINSLNASTSTNTSANTSNASPDSRSAFTYDNTSPSSLNHDTHEAHTGHTHTHTTTTTNRSHTRTHTGTGLTFDTISYASASPVSVHYAAYAAQNRSTATLVSSLHELGPLETSLYPTPSASSLSDEDYLDDIQAHAQATALARADHNVHGHAHDNAYSHGHGHGYVHDLATAAGESYPGITAATKADAVFMITDQQLSDRFSFEKEIGFGNWGSVWLCKLRRVRSELSMPQSYGYEVRLGRAAALTGGGGAGGKVAIKLVHRNQDPTTAARVKALWGEMKIIRSLRHEPHPSIIQFEAFVITSSFALVIMPYLSHLIPVALPANVAVPYLRQLASAVGYLHERGITHNDIKPANVMISHNDVPVLVDFGFAQRWELGQRGSFLSSISWGTPEYLDPHRARGMPHDERASDVWALGITMFEILIGRTPFEEDGQEQFTSAEDYLLYYERAGQGKWLGEWSMPSDLENLIRGMIQPDPAYRFTAMQSYHHPALQPVAPSVIITPHFVRAAPSFDFGEDAAPPIPAAQAGETQDNSKAGKNGEKKTRKKKKDASARERDRDAQVQPARAATPALGESIKQHTSVPRKVAQVGKGKDAGAGAGAGGDGRIESSPSPKKQSKLVIKKSHRTEDIENKAIEQDPTPTKITKPAQPLRVKELVSDKAAMPRTSQSELGNLSRPTASASLSTAGLRKTESKSTIKGTEPSRVTSAEVKVKSTDTVDKRISALSAISAASTAPHNKEEAVLKTMRSLEGGALAGHAAEKGKILRKIPSKRDVLANITRPAPEPPRPQSLDSAKSAEGVGAAKKGKDEQRRSLGLERTLEEVQEEAGRLSEESLRAHAETTKTLVAKQTSAAQTTATVAPVDSRPKSIHLGSPQRLRAGKRPPAENDADAKPLPPALVQDDVPVRPASPGTVKFPTGPDAEGIKAFANLRERIVSADHERLVRYRQVSGGLMPVTQPTTHDEVKPGHSISAEGATQVEPPSAETKEKQTDAVMTQETAPIGPAGPAAPAAPAGTGDAAITRVRSMEALALDSRLDKISDWVKNVEKIVEDARKALAEGRNPPLPLLAFPAGIIAEPASTSNDQVALTTSTSTPVAVIENVAGPVPEEVIADTDNRPQHHFGLSPEKAVPAHLRTSSTQVEPATPPKWMSYAEAEEKVRMANKWIEENAGKRLAPKKERPSVGHVLKLFAHDKDKDGHKDKDKEMAKIPSRSATPEPNMHVPLKPTALRGAPSTPALRSSTARRMPLRRSESNLRNYNTMPTLVSLADAIRGSTHLDDDLEHESDAHSHSRHLGLRPYSGTSDEYLSDESARRDGQGQGQGHSPRRIYERFLDTTPGVVRQGDGWGSWSTGRAIGKPSSMASLRERARVLLGGERDLGGAAGAPTAGGGGRNIIDLAQVAMDKDVSYKRKSRDGLAAAAAAAGAGKIPRPATPGAGSVLGVSVTRDQGKNGMRGIWKGIKGMGGMGRKKLDKADYAL